MDVQTVINSGLTDLLTAAGTILLGFLTAYVKQHYSAKQVETAKSVAQLACSFAEELGHTLGINGSDKLNYALGQAKLLAGKYGINLTDEQWTGLINAAVNESRVIWDSVKGKEETDTTVAPDAGQGMNAPTVATSDQFVAAPEQAVADPVQPTMQETVQQSIQQLIQKVGQQASDQAVQQVVQKLQNIIPEAVQPVQSVAVAPAPVAETPVVATEPAPIVAAAAI